MASKSPYGEKGSVFSSLENIGVKSMKHKLRIGVSNKSPKSRVVTYKKVSPETKVKDVVGDASEVAIIVPGDSVKSVTIKNQRIEIFADQIIKYL